ncbi:uncharacterized protein LOC119551218 [Drosophila subpulchrella]|uniref:uncharacterized protein LOC119551218 n=1 Tax=Drosophila subpulchrella TaxID=1486046 RepID=UPI0018A1B2D0|nr:uncharacterized protein LOC119551218 [Drosophila subpulchrella]
MTSLLISAVLLLLALSPGSEAQDTTSAMCRTDELCTTVKRCEDSDDSGRMGIGPRISRYCGTQRVCCEKAQLESWDRSQSLKTRVVSSAIRDKSSHILEPPPNESCGLNMECVPRRLCRDNVINDSGVSLINPRITNTDSGCAGLHRCCSVDQVESISYQGES